MYILPGLQKTGITSCYLVSSMLTTVINKYILTNLKFNMVFFYLSTQSIAITITIYILSMRRIVRLRDFTLKVFLTWLPCSTLLTLMIYTGAKSIDNLPISLFTLFKNFSIIFIAVSENFMYNIRMDRFTFISFLFMIVSSGIGEYSDFHIEFIGMSWMTLNIISSASYILLFKYIIDTENASNFESIFFNNLISTPILTICCLFTETMDTRLLVLNQKSCILIGLIILSCVFAFLIAFSTSLVLKNLSSTTFSFLGAINKVLVSFSGILIIGEKNVNIYKISSIIIGALASLLYIRRISKE